MLPLDQLGRELVQRLDLLLLGCEALLEVLVLLQESLHRVQGVADVLVSQEGLGKQTF